MVYPGGPSRGCYTCRARKVKCDEARPVCQRCIKGNRTCGGYRVLDQDGSRRRSPSSTRGPSPGRNQQLSPIQNRQSLSRSTSPRSAHDIEHGSGCNGCNIEEQLTGFHTSPSTIFTQSPIHPFYSLLARLPQAGSIFGGALTCLPNLLSKSQGQSPLLPAMSALLLTFVSRGNRGGSLVPEAITCYSNALQLTRRVVDEQNDRKRNEIMLTIFILSMYDDLNNTDHTKYTSNSHVQGAMAFIRSQKCRNFDELISKRLYSAFVNRAMYTCFGNESDMHQNDFPFTIDELHLLHAALIRDPPASPRLSLQRFTCKLLIVHLQLKEIMGSWSYRNDPVGAVHDILETITAIEHQLSEWPRSLPQEWKYMTVELASDGVDPWSKLAHVYPTLWAGNDWSHYRALRILIHSLRLRSFHLLTKFIHGGLPMDGIGLEDLVTDINTTHDNIRDLANDICISMPYHLGYRDTSGEIRYPSEAFPSGKYARVMSICHVLWPLYIAGIVEGVDLAQKLWVSRQLDVVGTELGIGKANVLAELVRKSAIGDPILSLGTEYVC